MQAVRAFFFIKMNQSFGVAVSAELMSLGDQILAQFLVVVDLAIEDHPDAAILVRDRLMTGAEIDDAEPAHPDAAGTVGVDTFIVGPAVADEVAHRPHVCNLRVAIPKEKSRDPAHSIRNAITPTATGRTGPGAVERRPPFQFRETVCDNQSHAGASAPGRDRVTRETLRA